jgi:hypothetical protein
LEVTEESRRHRLVANCDVNKGARLAVRPRGLLAKNYAAQRNASLHVRMTWCDAIIKDYMYETRLVHKS